MSISRAELTRRIIGAERLVSPILDFDERTGQIGNGSVDVRLGHQFIVFNKATGFQSIDPTNRRVLEEQLRKHHQSILRIGYGGQLYLHPGDFVIARTFEYMNMPRDWIAYVVGRSSWGRLGVVIATATLINPDFKGTITLEITNLGEVNVSLIPLMRIAQLTFHSVAEEPHNARAEVPASDRAATQQDPS